MNSCKDCGDPATYFGPDPFASEIYADYTEVHLCEDCFRISVMEI